MLEVGFGGVALVLFAVGGWLWADVEAAAGAAVCTMGLVFAAGAVLRFRGRRALPPYAAPPVGPDGPPPAPVYGEEAEVTGTQAELYGGPRPDPGERIAVFEARRPFLSSTGGLLVSLGVALGLWVFTSGYDDFGLALNLALSAFPLFVLMTGRYAVVETVPPPGGRRTYLVYTEGLAVETDTGRRTVRWEDVRAVWHRPETAQDFGSHVTTYSDCCVLALTGTGEPLPVYGARRQAVLSGLIIEHTRDALVRRLATALEQHGAIRLGDLTLSGGGVYDTEGRFLPWSPDWSLGGLSGARGPQVVINTRDGKRLLAAVPELQVATALLGRESHARAAGAGAPDGA
ncbi:hypothetical protein DVA86_15830 [Streptomyces armeniacus]|uniref:Uncharacterized protein n=1 Tax=Streptomyces armeniacus TaxID=83291 RepID=A0A345XQJ4_9ACTN|nr:hypothetical protein [Streptomyces armeniacus]AXK33910.1 hypothetical protein DVA86_15830 [Streptomyces armeniacus]